jgi:hypothetical protein
MSEQVNPALARKVANVKQNRAFKKGTVKNDIVNIIVKELQKNPDRSKTEVSCIIRCCNLIENLVKKKYKLDKFDIVVQVFTNLFGGLNPTELDQLRKSVQTVLDDKLIKKIPKRIEVYNYAKRVFAHNFLFRDE